MSLIDEALRRCQEAADQSTVDPTPEAQSARTDTAPLSCPTPAIHEAGTTRWLRRHPRLRLGAIGLLGLSAGALASVIVGVGESIGGATLLAITKTLVLLRRDDGSEILLRVSR